MEEESTVVYRATTSFTSDNADELSYQKDDLLEVYIPISSVGAVWYKASNQRTGKNGFVQLNNLVRCDGSSMTTSSSSYYLPVNSIVGDPSGNTNNNGSACTGITGSSSSGATTIPGIAAASNNNSSNSTADADCSNQVVLGGGGTTAVTTVVATMANLTLTKSTKDSNNLPLNVTTSGGPSGNNPYALEDIYVECVNPSNAAGRDYIWGLGMQGRQCIQCWSCFHIQCLPLTIHEMCQRNTDAYPKTPKTYSTEKSINEWTSKNVLEWMAANNLYSYADVFKAKDIKGCDLTNLDRDKLGQMGIKNDFHQQTILASIKDLLESCDKAVQCGKAIRATNVGGGIVLGTTNEETDSMHDKRSHDLVDHSFSKLVKCDKCHRYLRGLIHQGLKCKQCNLIVHRQCSATGLKSCAVDAGNWAALPSRNQHIFGMGLSQQFNYVELPAPQIVIILCNELEQKAMCNMNLDLYKLYRTTPPNYDEVNKLRDALNENLLNTDLSGYSPECVATVLKKFLRELPDPIIPFMFYDKFLEISNTLEDSSAIEKLKQYIQDMSIYHNMTLKYIMIHLIRICRLQYQRGLKEQPTILIQVWCHILMRPPWEKIVQIVYNAENHLRIMELLLYKLDWKEKLPEFMSAPAVPPRKISRSATVLLQAQQSPQTPSASTGGSSGVGSLKKAAIMSPAPPATVIQSLYNNASNGNNNGAALDGGNRGTVALPPVGDVDTVTELRDAEWYWGKITRDEAKEKMTDVLDGSFLVRDATSGGGEYTLTLKKDGTDRVIKIYHTLGRYGFTKDCSHNSVVELINFYRTVSLKEYNTLLDIKLMYPISRFDDDNYIGSAGDDTPRLAQKFIETSEQLNEKQHEREKLSDQYKTAKNQVELKKQAQEAFDEAEKLFNEQLSIQIKFEQEAQRHEKQSLTNNNKLIHDRLEELVHCKNQLKDDMDAEKSLIWTLEREINKIKPEILTLSRAKSRYEEELKRQGVTDSQLKQMLSDGYFSHNQSSQEQLPHNDESNWLKPNFNRQDAEQCLSGKPTGTFLIRARSGGHYALSITCNSTVNHCIIHQTERGYGFAEPYNIYDSLKSLVLHYANNSLEEHNDILQTTLKYPAFQCKQQQQSN